MTREGNCVLGRSMKRKATLVLGAVAGVCVLGFAGFALAGSVTINLDDEGPEPAAATVVLGDTVQFVGVGRENHAVIAPGFTIPLIYPGETHEVKMEVPGKISYKVTGFGHSSRGTIEVVVPEGLELSASSSSVPYKAPVMLKGKSPLKNAEVVLESRRAAGGSGVPWTKVTGVPTADDGSFSAVVHPEITTSYRVTIGGGKVRSELVTVDVTPILTISAKPRTLKEDSLLRVVGKVVPPTAATQIDLAQYDRTRNIPGWKPVLRRVVPATGTVVFNWPVIAGRTPLRLQTSKQTTRAGFKATNSASILVTGIAKPAPPVVEKPKRKKHHKKTQSRRP
jgi:plastocyanin